MRHMINKRLILTVKILIKDHKKVNHEGDFLTHLAVPTTIFFMFCKYKVLRDKRDYSKEQY